MLPPRLLNIIIAIILSKLYQSVQAAYNLCVVVWTKKNRDRPGRASSIDFG